jgi:hypothetical protein
LLRAENGERTACYQETGARNRLTVPGPPQRNSAKFADTPGSVFSSKHGTTTTTMAPQITGGVTTAARSISGVASQPIQSSIGERGFRNRSRVRPLSLSSFLHKSEQTSFAAVQFPPDTIHSNYRCNNDRCQANTESLPKESNSVRTWNASNDFTRTTFSHSFLPVATAVIRMRITAVAGPAIFLDPNTLA